MSGLFKGLQYPGLLNTDHCTLSETSGMDLPFLYFVVLRFAAIQVWVPMVTAGYTLPSMSVTVMPGVGVLLSPDFLHPLEKNITKPIMMHG